MPGSVSLMTYGAAVSESYGIPEIHGGVDLMMDLREIRRAIEPKRVCGG